MRNIRTRSGMAPVTVALLLVMGLLLSSCATTGGVGSERPPETLELVLGLEQTREIDIENKLTYALSRLFGIENVVVLVSSRARFGSIEETEEVQAYEEAPERLLRRTGGPGEIQRVTVAVLINSDVLTPEEREDMDRLREGLYPLVADGAGLLIDDEFGDSVSILFMPFAN